MTQKGVHTNRLTARECEHWFFGHPQTCVYPDVCLGIAHVSGKDPFPDKGSGRYTLYLPDVSDTIAAEILQKTSLQQ